MEEREEKLRDVSKVKQPTKHLLCPKHCQKDKVSEQKAQKSWPSGAYLLVEETDR